VEDAVIVGAGPQGLAVAAWLRRAGVQPRVFGEVMAFWTRHMPRGMLLRSSKRTSSIADPQRAARMEAYEGERGEVVPDPIPIESFIDYGRWYQRREVPEVDERRIESIEPVRGGFRLQTDAGEELVARRVVVATGMEPFAWRPPELSELPPELASHPFDHPDLSVFGGPARPRHRLGRALRARGLPRPCRCRLRRHGGGQHATFAGAWSRALLGRVRLPEPRLDEAAFASALESALRKRPHDVLLCSTEAAALAVSAHRHLFDGLYRHGLPAHDVLERCLDKGELLEVAAAAGLDAPPSSLCENADEAQRAAAHYGFPAMAKPRRSLTGFGARRGHASSAVVASPEELADAVARFGLPLIVQRREAGATIYSVGGVFADGRLLASAGSRYARTWPRGPGRPRSPRPSRCRLPC
jgi:hypothetical protein